MSHDAPSIDLATLKVPPPLPTALSNPFWAAAAQGRLQFQQCGACGQFAAYPRELCPRCWSCQQQWKEVSGTGQIETFSRVHHAGNAGWQAATPYVVALVRLAEGPVLLTQLVTGGREPRAGDRCHVAFTRVGDWTLPFFSLVDDPKDGQAPGGTP